MAEAGIAALPIATLTTDFGTADGYVAAMKGVMLGINPGLALVDVSHEVPPQNVPHGAFVLAEAVRYFPAGAVHLAVVDPGVGGRRKPLLLVTPDASYVAPDNGLLTHALARYGSGHDPRAEWLSSDTRSIATGLPRLRAGQSPLSPPRGEPNVPRPGRVRARRGVPVCGSAA